MTSSGPATTKTCSVAAGNCLARAFFGVAQRLIGFPFFSHGRNSDMVFWILSSRHTFVMTAGWYANLGASLIVFGAPLRLWHIEVVHVVHGERMALW